MVNSNEIKAYIKRKGITQEILARNIKINPSTLNKKINNVNGNNLTVREVCLIVRELNIPKESLVDIFFAEKLA